MPTSNVSAKRRDFQLGDELTLSEARDFFKRAEKRISLNARPPLFAAEHEGMRKIGKHEAVP